MKQLNELNQHYGTTWVQAPNNRNKWKCLAEVYARQWATEVVARDTDLPLI